MTTAGFFCTLLSETIGNGGTEMTTRPNSRKTRNRKPRVTQSSGNVFADLGLPNPEQELLKEIGRAHV